MKRERFGAILLALLVLISGVGALGGTVAASENVAYDGTQADSADQTNTTYIATNSDLDNVTIQMTEDQSVTSGSSVVFNTSYEAASATINSSSGSGTLSATVNSGNVTITETGGTSSATLESLNITFNVTTSSDEAGINASYDNWMENESALVEDPDASEVQNYLVYARDKVVDVEKEIVDSDLEFNESENDLEANGSDTSGQFAFHLTRNNTTYEDVPLSELNFEVAFNTTYFSDLSEETDLSTDTVVLTDIYTEDGAKHYTLSLQQPDNTSSDYWEDITVRFNATAEAGEENETLAYSTIQDPDGGVQSEATSTYDHAAPTGIVAPQLTEVGDIPDWAFFLGAGIMAAVVVALVVYRQEGMAMAGFGLSDRMFNPMNLFGMLIGLLALLTVADALLGSPIRLASFFVSLGIPGPGVIVIASVVLLGIIAINARMSSAMR